MIILYAKKLGYYIYSINLYFMEKNFLDKMDGLGGDNDGRELIDDKLGV